MKSWKTTIIGLLGAIFTMLQPIIETGTFDIKKDYPALIKGALLAAMGFFAKDFNVTGNPAETIGVDVPEKKAIN